MHRSSSPAPLRRGGSGDCLNECLSFQMCHCNAAHLPVQAGVQAAGCPNNWLDYNGHCYGYFAQEVNWNRAEVSGRKGVEGSLCLGRKGLEGKTSVLGYPRQFGAEGAAVLKLQGWFSGPYTGSIPSSPTPLWFGVRRGGGQFEL